MKKVLSYFILSFLSIVVGINSVAAVDVYVGEKFGYNSNTNPSSCIENRFDNNGKGPYDESATYNYTGAERYYYTDGSIEIAAYCIDPTATVAKYMEIKKELGNNSSSTGRELSFDVAIKDVLSHEIATNGPESNLGVIAHTVRLVTSSMAMNIGLASDGNDGWPTGRMLAKTYITQSAKWISDSADAYEAWYKAYYGMKPTKILTGDEGFQSVLNVLYGVQTTYPKYNLEIEKKFVFKPSSDLSMNCDSSYGQAQLNEMKSLFINALKAAAKVRMNGKKTNSDSFKLALSNGGTMLQKQVGSDTYLYRDIVYVVDTSVYDRDKGFMKNFKLTSTKYSSNMKLEYS